MDGSAGVGVDEVAQKRAAPLPAGTGRRGASRDNTKLDCALVVDAIRQEPSSRRRSDRNRRLPRAPF